MAELKPMKAAAAEAVSVEQDFKRGRRTLLSPKSGRVRRGDDKAATPVKLFFYGPIGSGKTDHVTGLLRAGLKVLVMSTDAGGSGLTTVKLRMRQLGLEHLLVNLFEVVLSGYEEVQEFLEEPAVYFPTIYDEDLDWLVWDGFSNWQQVDLSEKIGAIPIEKKNGELAPAVQEGLFFDYGQWGMMRNATVRNIHNFCSLNNKKTGKVWHKSVTSLENIRKMEGAKEFTEQKEPLLQGAGGVLIEAAFDLIIRTKVQRSKDAKGDLVEEYLYQIKAENKRTKNRGFVVDNVIPADMAALWSLITFQLGIPNSLVDENLKGPVLV